MADKVEGKMSEVFNAIDTLIENCNRAIKQFNPETDKGIILDAYQNWKPTNARNSMGCPEDWYCYPFSISRTFSREEVENMDEKTISYLVRLANNLSDAFY